MAGLAGVDGAEAEGRSGVDTRQPCHFAERSERRAHPPGVPPYPAPEAKTQVAGRNAGWRTKHPVTRRSGDKTPGFRVTGVLVGNGHFGLDGNGRFGQRSVVLFLHFHRSVLLRNFLRLLLLSRIVFLHFKSDFLKGSNHFRS